MTCSKLTGKDYPLAENRVDLVQGHRGKTLDELDLESLETGDANMQDLRITSEALRMQGDIARDANREKLADNFDRASELVDVPQDYLMEIYELLRPGRAAGKASLQAVADNLRTAWKAERMAEFIEEAAEVYEQRGLFTSRF